MTNSEEQTNEVANYRTLEIDRRSGTFNLSGSNYEKNTTDLTLDTYPEVQSSTTKNASIIAPFSESKYTTVQVRQPLSKPRIHRIIDKLSELTNIKLRNAASTKYRNLGLAHEPKLINGSTKSKKSEHEMISNSRITLDYALKTKSDEINSASLASLNDKSTVNKLTNSSLTATSTGENLYNPHADNKEPNAFNVSKGFTMTNANLTITTAESEAREHVSEESRVITADQIGMNRPTRVPFHFTTTLFPIITTTIRETTPAIHYQKVPSPHNHIFAPTQDPINIAHGENVNGDDLKDFHVAHLSFGTKVGSVIPAIPSSKKIYKLPTAYGVVGHKVATPKDLKNKNTPYVPPPYSKESNNFNSATRHNHLKKKSNNINEQLPFFKEQGGIFEQQQPNLQIEPNEIQLRQKIADVTYASKGPAAQPQTNVYSTPKQTQPLYSPHPKTPQYVQIPQQLYLAPVPLQQTVQPFNQNPIPITNYYNPHSAIPPVQVPTYYTSPTLSHPHNPAVSLAPQYIAQNDILPGNINYPRTSLEPSQRQINSNAKHLYYSPSRNNPDPYLHEHGRPPPREFPDSNTFYGSPVALPPKPQSTRVKSAKKANLKYSRTEPRIRSYEDRRHSEGPDITATHPRHRHSHSAVPQNRVAPISQDRGDINYNEDIYENIDEIDSIPGRSNTGNQKFQNYDTPDSLYESPERYSFSRSSNPRPNFENPNTGVNDRNSGGNRFKNRPTHESSRHRYADEDPGIEHAAAGDIPKRNFPVLDPIYTRTIQQYDQESLKPESSPENDRNSNDEYSDAEDTPTSFRSNPRRYHTDSNRNDEADTPHTEDEDDSRPKLRRQHQRNRESEEEEEEASDVPSKQTSDEEEEAPSNQTTDEEEETPSKQTAEEDEEQEEATPSKQTADEEEEEEQEEETPSKQTADEEEEEEQEEQPKKQQRSNKKPPPKKPKDEKSGNLDDDIDGIEREFGSFGTGGGNSGPPQNVQYHPILG